MIYFLGFDPGKNGGYCILDGDKNIVECGVMPTIGKSKPEYDKQRLRELFKKYSYAVIGIEKPGVIYGIGKTSMMSLGHAVGLLEGMANMTGARVLMIPPKEWQKEMWKHTPKKTKKSKGGRNTTDTKATSESAALGFYPTYDFRKSSRSCIRHDGKIDATLVARYSSEQT